MGSSVRRKKMRLQTGVTKMVCHLVDWPVSRGGRCFTWAARKQMKGPKGPSERKNYVGLWGGTPNRVAKILSSSKSLFGGCFSSDEAYRSSLPALPPRRNQIHQTIKAFPPPMGRKLRHSERKFIWCTERANQFFAKNLRLASLIERQKPYATRDWYVKTKLWYETFHKRAKALGCQPHILRERSFRTIGQYALTKCHLTEFMKVYLAFGYEWDPDLIGDDSPVCICVHTPTGVLNRQSCRIHKLPPRPKIEVVRKNGDRKRIRPPLKKSKEVDRFSSNCTHSGGVICRFCGRRVR